MYIYCIPLSQLFLCIYLYLCNVASGIMYLDILTVLQKMYPAREEQAQEFFLRYTKRGPRAFPILIETLRKTGHESEANLLAENAVTELSGYDGATVEPTELFSSTSTSPSLSIG